jgi:uncharacterized RDD family membrane protein YckC
MNLSTELKIETPEGIQFSYPLAGPVSRCLAWVIDAIIVMLLLGAVQQVIVMFSLLSPDLAIGLGIVGYFVVSIGYGVTMEWFWRGQTVGKRLLRMRVMDIQGLRLQFHQVLMRNLLRAVDSLPATYLLGGCVCLFTRYAQRLGDLAAGTVVVHLVRHIEPDLEQLLAGKFNSLRVYPHLTGRLRQRVSAEEAGLALQALLRREELEPAARVDLFREIAQHFRNVVTFPPEAIESMSDEQFVRCVVDVLFRTRGEATERTRSPAPAPEAVSAGVNP